MSITKTRASLELAALMALEGSAFQQGSPTGRRPSDHTPPFHQFPSRTMRAVRTRWNLEARTEADHAAMAAAQAKRDRKNAHRLATSGIPVIEADRG